MSHTNRSPFAQALADLLVSDPKVSLTEWALWLNPWYRERKTDGTLGGARCVAGSLADEGEQLSEEELRLRRESFERNWVPCYTIGEGVTIAKIESWMNDEEMPSPGELNLVLGYVGFFESTPQVQAATTAFYKVLTQYAGNVTPHGREYVFIPHNFGTIGARMVMERFGAISFLLHLPPERWDQMFEKIAVLFNETGV